MIGEGRVKKLNKKLIRNGKYVLYWMQASHRTEYNQALEYAISKANKINRPVVIYFGITELFPEANERHYYFMLEGLRDVQSSLEEKGIGMIVRHKSPELGAIELSENASLVVVDRGYLRTQKSWRRYVAQNIDCPLVQVECDVIVPVETASPREEYSAATIRPKIEKKLGSYIIPLKENRPNIDFSQKDFLSFNIENTAKAVSSLEVSRSVTKVEHFHGGTTEAKKHLEDFLRKKLDYYEKYKNDPTKEFLSNMSPYLNFGQISPIYIALKILETESSGTNAYLEELIVRRELSANFVFYNHSYDSFNGLPQWAKKTLNEHEKDPRRYIYSLGELENAETHDAYWNAAQKEMRIKGKMHGYMRMYWGKKIIEWTKTPREAFKNVLYLNNKYELDGRGPNGFAGVAWCFGKHDRPYKEREVFGKIRYMNANGLKRKFDADRYIDKIS